MIWSILKAILLVGFVVLAGIGAVSCILLIGVLSDDYQIKKRNKKQD